MPLFGKLRGDGEGRGRRRLSDVLTGGGAQLIRGGVAARRGAPTHQGARGHAAGRCFTPDERAGGDAIPVAANGGRVSGQRGAGLAQASLEGGAGRRVGGHGAVEGIGAAGDGVDAHDVDLGALGGGGAVGVGGGGAVRRNVRGGGPPAAQHKTKYGKWIFVFTVRLKKIYIFDRFQSVLGFHNQSASNQNLLCNAALSFKHDCTVYFASMDPVICTPHQ